MQSNDKLAKWKARLSYFKDEMGFGPLGQSS
jgi:hypothetical protein